MPPHYACDAAGTDLSAGQGRNGRALVCDAIQAITLRMGGLSLGREDFYQDTPQPNPPPRTNPTRHRQAARNHRDTYTDGELPTTTAHPFPSTPMIQALPVQAHLRLVIHLDFPSGSFPGSPKICDTSGFLAYDRTAPEIPHPTSLAVFVARMARNRSEDPK